MKKYVLISLLITLLLLPLYSGGKSDEVPAEDPVQQEQPENTGDESDLYIRMNRLGFDTPTGTLASIEFELANLQGVKEKLSDYKGQVVFLNFWATWCGPCRSEMPAMESVYKELKDDGFVIVAVDLAEEQPKVADFVDEFQLTFPVLLDSDGAVGSMYDARSIPTTYLIDREGNILGRAIGVRPWEDEAFVSLFKDILEM